MNVQEPYRYSSINLENITYKKIKNMTNRKLIYLKYKDNNKNNNFVIQLSKLYGNNIISSNEIEFNVSSKLISFFNNLDDYIISEAHKNSELWFDHIKDKSSIDYQRILNVNNTIKLKLINTEEFITKCYVNEQEITNFNDINTNDTTNKIILECYAIWVKGNSFGLLLRPVNISLSYVEKYNYKFLNDSELDEDDELDDNDELSDNEELEKLLILNKHEQHFNNFDDTNIFYKRNNVDIININIKSEDSNTSSDTNLNLNKLILN